MFQPSYFKQTDTKEMLNFIQNHPLATLVSQSSQGLVGNHIPMIVTQREGHYFLQGHVARANKVWQDIIGEADVLAIFTGPEAYISPNWYPSKKIDGKAVPTWNYMAVHVAGALKHFEDEVWLRQHLIKLSNFNEKTQPKPWKLSDAPVAYIQKMMGAIVGIEIEIKHITGQSKMSQNHTQENRNGVISGLLSENKLNVADKIKNPKM